MKSFIQNVKSFLKTHTMPNWLFVCVVCVLYYAGYEGGRAHMATAIRLARDDGFVRFTDADGNEVKNEYEWAKMVCDTWEQEN